MDEGSLRAAKKVRIKVNVDSVHCDYPQGVDGAVDLTVFVYDAETNELLKAATGPVPMERGNVFNVTVEIPALSC